MAALSFRYPADSDRYRDATAGQARMAGVCVPTFRCACCGQVKTNAGRKPRVPGYSKAGYACRDCVAEANQVPA